MPFCFPVHVPRAAIVMAISGVAYFKSDPVYPLLRGIFAYEVSILAVAMMSMASFHVDPRGNPLRGANGWEIYSFR
jgi:hypothetical protein